MPIVNHEHKFHEHPQINHWLRWLEVKGTQMVMLIPLAKWKDYVVYIYTWYIHMLYVANWVINMLHVREIYVISKNLFRKTTNKVRQYTWVGQMYGHSLSNKLSEVSSKFLMTLPWNCFHDPHQSWVTFFLLRHSFPPLNVSGFFWCWLETINHHHTWDRVIWRRAYQPTPTSLDKSIHVMLHVMKLTSSLMQLQLPSWKSNLSSFHLACVITVFVYILTLI